jgi:hypothetical protein
MNRQNPIFKYLLLLIIGCLIILACVGCKTPQLPTLPTNAHRDSNDSIRTELRIDTIYQDRWHKEYQKGDTTFIHDSIDRWHKKYVYIHDSIDNSRIDTIYQPVPVEKKGSAFLRNSGIALWVIIGLILLAVIAGIFVKFAK